MDDQDECVRMCASESLFVRRIRTLSSFVALCRQQALAIKRMTNNKTESHIMVVCRSASQEASGGRFCITSV